MSNIFAFNCKGKTIPYWATWYFWANNSRLDYQWYGYLVAAILTLYCNTNKAQTPSYIHYDVRDGLPSNLVYCAYQDRSGIMWFGTDKGLARFDGIRFHVYSTQDGLPDPEILSLWEDTKNRLWIANFQKHPCFRINGHFISANKDETLKKVNTDHTYTFFEDQNGGINFASKSHNVFILQDSAIMCKRYMEALVRDDGIFCFVKLGLETFALGNRVIILCQPNNNDIVVQSILTPPPFPFISATVSGNRLLYALANGMLLFEWKDNQMIKIGELFGGPSGQVFTDSKGRFWVCSQKFGAVCFDNLNQDLSNPTLFLPGKKITSMIEDNQGTLWFCTIGEGIFALPKHRSLTYTQNDGLYSINISALSIDVNGRLWCGDDEGNIHILSSGKIECTWSLGAADGYNRCRQIVALPNGNCWIVSDDYLMWSDGIGIYPSIHHLAYKAALWQSNKLWYISFSHLGYLSPERPYYSVRYQNRRFTTIGEDLRLNLWAGQVEGLFSAKDSFSYNWGEQFAALKSRIIAIQPADSNHIWVVSSISGLLWVQINYGTVEKVDVVNDRLTKPINNIQSIFIASDRRLWLATNSGVYGLSPDWRVQHFDHHNGLAADDVNAVVVQEDTLWAGTVSGLTRLVISSADETGEYPTLIASLRYRLGEKIYNYNLIDSLVSQRFTRLPADARLVEFDLAALDYRSRGNLQFDYSFKPELLPWFYWTPGNLFDCISQWFNDRNTPSHLESSTLNLGVQLNPGQYHFAVTAISSNGIYSNHPSEWTLLMTPKWYQTIWAILSFWGLVGGVFWQYRRIRSANRKLNTLVSHLQLQSLQSQINPHFVGNSINAIQQFFYPFDSIKSSRYLALFTRLLRQTLGFSENTFIPFENEIVYLKDYLFMAKMRLGENFIFDIQGWEEVPPSLPFPVMLLQPMIENATIHGIAPDGNSLLSLQFDYSEQKITCLLLDNGLGINATMTNKKSFLLYTNRKD